MKNTILISLLLFMTFCCESAFARSDEKVIIKTERVGNDTAEWSFFDEKNMIFVKFKKEDLKAAKLEKIFLEKAKLRKKEMGDYDAMSYFIFDSEEGKKALDSIQTIFLENLSQKQIVGLLDASRLVTLSITLNGRGRVVEFYYILPAIAENLFTSYNLYDTAKEIKKKVRFGKPSHYGYNSAGYRLARIKKETLERYLKKE